MNKSNKQNIKPFRVYISGKMSGMNTFEYERLFLRAEQHLRLRGYEPINPVTLGKWLSETVTDREPTYKEYMINDISAIWDCDGVYMLRNWRTSKGARIERIIAQELGLFIAYETIS